MNVLRFLQEVDRRFLYALILFVVAVPFFLNVRIPVQVSPPTEALYDTIDRLPAGSFVLLSVDWGASTRGENRPQTIALMTHLMRKKLRFAMLSFEPQSKTICQNIALDLAKQYHYREGVDWVNFGYKPDQDNYLKAFVLDIPGSVSTDIHGHPLTTLPVMQGVKTARDITLLLDVTPSDTYNSYIKFMQGPYHLPMGVAPTSVMTPEATNRLDSKQLIGLVPGLQGAVEYEQKLGITGKATHASISSSAAHFLIIAFILLGNLAMVVERRRAARMGGGR